MNTEATCLMYDCRSLGVILTRTQKLHVSCMTVVLKCNINMNTEATCLMYDCRSLGVIST